MPVFLYFWCTLVNMKARISSKGRALLKNPRAVYAMLDAIHANQDAFFNGEPVSFAVAAAQPHTAGQVEKKVVVRLASAVDNDQ